MFLTRLYSARPMAWRRMFSALPAHDRLVMPALSPTMTKGTIAQWVKQPGDKISPGDVICTVETDKAVVDFEAQEDGYLAKIIIDAGPQEVALGSVIAIVVEEESDVPAFKDFKVEQNVAAPAPPAAAEKPAAPQSQPQAAAPQTQAPPAAASAPRAQEMPAPVPAAPVAPPTAIPAPSASTQSISTAEDADSYVAFPNWGKSLDRSPFASTFLQKQKEYVEKYGFAGQDLE